MAQDASSGRRPGPVRRLAAFLWLPDERPAVTGAARAADAAIAVVCALGNTPAMITQNAVIGYVRRNASGAVVKAAPIRSPVDSPGPG